MNKKGLNEIISLVLFILLILSLIAVLYYFISPSVSQGGKQLDPAAACLKVQIEPIECAYADCSTLQAQPSYWIALNMKRNAANVSISDIRYVISDQQGRSITADHTRSVNPLFSLPLPQPNTYQLKGIPILLTPDLLDFVPDTLTVTPIVGSGKDKTVCPPITKPIKCESALRPANRCAECDQRTFSPPERYLNGNDFQCFINEYAARTDYGDFNGDSVFNGLDHMAYCIAWNARDCSSCQSAPGNNICNGNP